LHHLPPHLLALTLGLHHLAQLAFGLLARGLFLLLGCTRLLLLLLLLLFLLLSRLLLLFLFLLFIRF